MANQRILLKDIETRVIALIPPVVGNGGGGGESNVTDGDSDGQFCNWNTGTGKYEPVPTTKLKYNSTTEAIEGKRSLNLYGSYDIGTLTAMFQLTHSGTSTNIYGNRYNNTGFVKIYGGNTYPYIYIDATGKNISLLMSTALQFKIDQNGILSINGSRKNADKVADMLDGTNKVIAPASSVGWGRVAVGENTEWARFRFDSAGVTLEASSTNIATSDTSGKFCIFRDSSSQELLIKNRLGSTHDVLFSVDYME